MAAAVGTGDKATQRQHMEGHGSGGGHGGQGHTAPAHGGAWQRRWARGTRAHSASTWRGMAPGPNVSAASRHLTQRTLQAVGPQNCPHSTRLCCSPAAHACCARCVGVGARNGARGRGQRRCATCSTALQASRHSIWSHRGGSGFKPQRRFWQASREEHGQGVALVQCQLNTSRRCTCRLNTSRRCMCRHLPLLSCQFLSFRGEGYSCGNLLQSHIKQPAGTHQSRSR